MQRSVECESRSGERNSRLFHADPYRLALCQRLIYASSKFTRWVTGSALIAQIESYPYTPAHLSIRYFIARALTRSRNK